MSAPSSSSYSLGDNKECPFCCELYDNGPRRKIPCPKCGSAICKTDVLQFMETNLLMPQCPIKDCAQEFDEIYLFKILPAKDAPIIRRYFRRILLEQAKSRFGPILTRIQEHGSRYLQPKKQYSPESLDLAEKISVLYRQIDKLVKVRAWLWECLTGHGKRGLDGVYVNGTYGFRVHQSRLHEAVERTDSKISTLQEEYGKAQYTYKTTEPYIWVDRHGTRVEAPARTGPGLYGSGAGDGPSIPRRSFVFPCGQGSCIGYLSTRWKCMICDKWRCNKCHEPKKDEEHKCDPNNVESAKFRMSQTSPCPKCGVPIEKDGGCNQMFCVSCKVGFDWRTGRIIALSQNSNHLAYEYRQRMGTLAPGEGPIAPCGDAINTVVLARRMFAFRMSSRDVAKAWDFRNLVDPHNESMMPSNDQVNLEDYSEKFLLGLVTETQLSNQAFKVYRTNNRNNHHNGIKMTLQTAGNDILNAIIRSRNAAEVRKHLQSIDRLVEYINKSFVEINASLLYKNHPIIDKFFYYHNSVGARSRVSRGKVKHVFKHIKMDVRELGIDQITDGEAQLPQSSAATQGLRRSRAPASRGTTCTRP